MPLHHTLQLCIKVRALSDAGPLLPPLPPRRITIQLKSRCAKVRFGAVRDTAVVELLRRVCAARGVTGVSDDVLLKLARASAGDVRQAVTLLQGGVARLGAAELTQSAVDELAGAVPSDVVSELWNTARTGTGAGALTAAAAFICEGLDPKRLLAMVRRRWVTSCFFNARTARRAPAQHGGWRD